MNDDTIILEHKEYRVKNNPASTLMATHFYVNDEMRPNTVGILGKMYPVYRDHNGYYFNIIGVRHSNNLFITEHNDVLLGTPADYFLEQYELIKSP